MTRRHLSYLERARRRSWRSSWRIATTTNPKFTFNYDLGTRSVDFLDIHIWIDSEGYNQMYQKPGKFCQLLLASSAHPSHICCNLSLSIAYRVRRLGSMTKQSTCAWNPQAEVKEWVVRAPCMGRTPPPCKPGRLIGRSKTAPSKQETRSRSRRSNKASPVRTTLWSTVLQCYQAGPRLRRPAQYVDKVGTARACRVRCIKHRGGSQEPLAGTRQLASTSTFLGTSGGLQLPSL